jgi:hypothetical protein
MFAALSEVTHMSSVSSVSAPAPTLFSSGTSAGRPSDGDTPAQEAAEGTATKMAETQNGGRAPAANSAGLVNKTA